MPLASVTDYMVLSLLSRGGEDGLGLGEGGQDRSGDAELAPSPGTSRVVAQPLPLETPSPVIGKSYSSLSVHWTEFTG